MGITETGYHRSTFEEIKEEITQKAKELFGEDIDVGDQTPLGKIINILAYTRAKDHENAELIYYSRFPHTARGTTLDRLSPFVGITRNVAIPARFEVNVNGKEGTTLPIGFLVSTESGIEYYNTTETTIAAGETSCTITAECTVAGTIGNVAAGDIKEIVNPDAGIDSVVGTTIIELGEDEESDYNFRQRIIDAGKGAGTGNADAIRAALLKVQTVTNAIVIVNDTNETDNMGNPPHSISCYVVGGYGYKDEIGKAIFQTKPVGIGTNGSIIVSVLDNGGHSHTVKYSTIQDKEVVVSISIETTTDFAGNAGIEEIQTNIKTYINSLGIGGDVVLSALYGHIYSVKGVSRVSSLTINGGTGDIEITDLQNAICTTVNVAEV